MLPCAAFGHRDTSEGGGAFRVGAPLAPPPRRPAAAAAVAPPSGRPARSALRRKAARPTSQRRRAWSQAGRTYSSPREAEL
eukprot:2612264-Alexandrium_andersonii.AAC.1